MTIDNIIDSILNRMNPNWPLLYKIRYIYLEVGKVLYKNTDFFFSIEKKLGNQNLDIEQIKAIYEDDKIDGVDFSVICKSGSYILKWAFDKAGIEAKLVKSANNFIKVEENGEVVKINHWFVAVKDETKTYFLSLSADLPYIQMGMKTKHFGADIPYCMEKDGELIQIYEGEEIKHTYLSDEDLYEIDKEIGYVNTYYDYNDKKRRDGNYKLNYNDYSLLFIKDAMASNKAYYEMEEEETNFYKNMFNLSDSITLNDFNNDLSDKEWNEWIKKLCQNVLNILGKIVGVEIKIEINQNWNYEKWLKEVCLNLEQHIYKFYKILSEERAQDSLIDNKEWIFSEWSRFVKKTSTRKTNGNYDYYNPLSVLDKVNTIVNFIKTKNFKRFSEVLHFIAFHDIDPELVPDIYLQNKEHLPNRYIANKFNKLFVKIFSCNDIKTSFNFMEYSEQIVIVKQILDLMFLELTTNNCGNFKKYNPLYSVTNNKINTYPIKSKKDGSYALIFYVIGSEGEEDYAFFFNPKTNEFRSVDILSVSLEYIIVSNRLKSMIDDLENIEVRRKK